MELYIWITIGCVLVNFIGGYVKAGNILAAASIGTNVAMCTLRGVAVSKEVSLGVYTHEKMHAKFYHVHIQTLMQGLVAGVFYYNLITLNFVMVGWLLIAGTLLNILIAMLCEMIADRNALTVYPEYIDDLSEHIYQVTPVDMPVWKYYISGYLPPERRLAWLRSI